MPSENNNNNSGVTPWVGDSMADTCTITSAYGCFQEDTAHRGGCLW